MGSEATTTQVQQAAEPVQPIPPRYWWLKRASWGMAILLLGIVCLRAWWGWYAQRQLQTFIDVCHARGEPILPEDFAGPPVPDAANAAVTLRRAATSLQLTFQQEDEMELIRHLPLSEREISSVGKVLLANGQALAQLRTARALTHVDWGVSPAQITAPPHGLLQLARVVRALVLYEHQRGNESAAMEYLRDLFFIRDAFDQAPSMTWHAVAMHIGVDYATRGVLAISPDLRIVDDRFPATYPTQVQWLGRTELHRLILDLLDESTLTEGNTRAWQGERSYGLALAQGFGQQKLMGPMFLLDGVRLMRGTTAVIEAMEPTWPATRDRMHSDPRLQDVPVSSNWQKLARMFTGLPGSGFGDRLRIRHFQHLAQRRAAAVALAIRLYQLDHDEARPSALGDLVPAYLPRVPADPFSAEGHALGYVSGPADPLLYSVGTSGTNPVSATKPSQPGADVLFDWPGVFHLARQPRPPESSGVSGEEAENQ